MPKTTPSPKAAALVASPEDAANDPLSFMTEDHPTNEGKGDSFLVSIADAYRGTWAVYIARWALWLIAWVLLSFSAFGVPSSMTRLHLFVGHVTAVFVMVFALSVFFQYAARRKSPEAIKNSYLGEPGEPINPGHAMVHWLGPVIFAETIYHVLNPRFKQDSRLKAPLPEIHVVPDTAQKSDGSVVFDFVADTGDGFNSTYSVASAMARDHEFKLPSGKKVDLPQASVVIHGGDIAYPFPRHESYVNRFFRPYAAAYPEYAKPSSNNNAPPQMFIAAGNHEWLDGGLCFDDLVVKRKTLGGWVTPQETKYYAIKFPHGWWFYVLDLGHEPEDIDDRQKAYFLDTTTKHVGKTDRVVLVYHTPDWIKRNMGFSCFENLNKLRVELGEKVRLTLAGDLHYYKRMEQVQDEDERACPEELATVTTEDAAVCHETDKAQLIVAGHGGAFTHPTSFPICNSVQFAGKTFDTRVNYPTMKECDEMWTGDWWRGFSWGKNSGYGHILALLYVMMFVSSTPFMAYDPNQDWDSTTFPGNETTINATETPFNHPELPLKNGLVFLTTFSHVAESFQTAFPYCSLAWFLVSHWIIVWASYPLKNKADLLVGLGLVLTHTIPHVCASILLRSLVDFALLSVVATFSAVVHPSVTGLVVFAYTILSNTVTYIGAYFVAPLVTNVYFHLTFMHVRWHYNEAFCTLEIQEKKGFIRTRILANGDMEIHAINVNRTPKVWTRRADDRKAKEDGFQGVYTPFEEEDVECVLLERIVLSKYEK